MRPLIALFFAMTTTTLAVGCGNGRPALVKVQGKITLNGEAVEGAQVAMLPITEDKAAYKRPSIAFTKADGTFVPQTYGNEDGIPVGKYKIGVVKTEVVGKVPDGFTSETAADINHTIRWLTPKSYSNPQSSGLEVEVTSGGMKPDTIELKSSLEKPEIERQGPQKSGA